MFADVGKVWNRDDNTREQEHAGTVGFGVRMAGLGMVADVGLAFSMLRERQTPQDGNPKGPRLLAKISYNF
jgi:hemolysin activation/secretion protein